MHLPAGFLAGLGQGFEKIPPIDIVQENLLAPVATARQVAYGTRIFDAQFSQHEMSLTPRKQFRQRRQRTILWVDPFTE